MAEIKIYAKPAQLFRYRPMGTKAAQEIAALRDRYIYCPAFSDMNDPMEGTHRLSNRFIDNPNSEKSRARVQAALEKMGIASMSEVHDHEPMWAHYADQFKGICIQYSLNRLLKGLDGNTAITRMMYSEQEPVLLNESSNSVDRARLCLSSKTVRWSSEREWRIFRAEKGRAQYAEANAVTKIFLGSRISDHDQELVLDLGSELSIPIAKMVIDAYSISFKPLIRRLRLIKR